jgi:hypothetical protein
VKVINSAVFPIVVVVQAIIVHSDTNNKKHNKTDRSPTTKKSKKKKKKKKISQSEMAEREPMHREIRTDSTITNNDALDVLGTASDGGRRFIRHLKVACKPRAVETRRMLTNKEQSTIVRGDFEMKISIGFTAPGTAPTVSWNPDCVAFAPMLCFVFWNAEFVLVEIQRTDFLYWQQKKKKKNEWLFLQCGVEPSGATCVVN